MKSHGMYSSALFLSRDLLQIARSLLHTPFAAQLQTSHAHPCSFTFLNQFAQFQCRRHLRSSGLLSPVRRGDSLGLRASGDLRLLNLSGLVLDRGVSSWGCLLLDLALRRLGPLSLAPRASIAVLAATRALAGTAELLGEVLGRDLLEDLRLVTAAKDVDLLHGDGVEPALDNTPDGGEAPGGVDKVHLAETLGVVVLGDDGGLADVGVDLGNTGDGDALEVDDRAAGLEEVTGFAGAGGETGVGDALVLDGEVVEHTLAGGDLVHGSQVDTAEGLDVDWAAILIWVSIGMQACRGMAALAHTLSVLW